jgi:hypothetical protein
MQRRARQWLHNAELHIVRLAYVADGDDIGVVQVGRSCDLGVKTPHKARIRAQLRRQDRRRSLHHRVRSAVDNAHDSAAEFGLDVVFSI